MSAQKQGNVWYFGNHAGISFNSGSPIPLLDGLTDFAPPLGWNEGSSCISDSSGALLFYSNGEKIWDSQQDVMGNGNDLMGHSSSSASSLIVPSPNSSQFFYVFTTDASENSFENGLQYSVVDICLNEGRGDVVSEMKNISLYDDVAEKLACVRHSNQTDYWILSHGYGSNEFYAFHLTEQGIEDTIISIVGPTESLGWGGQLVISPNGQTISYTTPANIGYSYICDFNSQNGEVSNVLLLSSGTGEWGTSFSPDNTKLYCGTNITPALLYQYDITSGNLTDILASKTVIASISEPSRHHQLGPDGVIYIAVAGQQYLSAINEPNESGIICQYVEANTYLGGRYSSFGLPNMITSYSYSNDLISCSTSAVKSYNSERATVYPNPFHTQSRVVFESQLNQVTMQIYDLGGRLVYEKMEFSGSEFLINRDGLKQGLYTLIIANAGQLISSAKLVIVDF